MSEAATVNQTGPLRIRVPFEHRYAGHCESGVTASLLRHHGVPVSEAMAFGIANGIFFGFFPQLKQEFLLVSFRGRPGSIFRNATRRLGVRVGVRRFADPREAMDALDRRLASGVPVGVQVGVRFLPFFPESLRVHFNVHNMIVFAREGDTYHVSDPVFPGTVTISWADLAKSRFVKGEIEPRGKMYWIERARPDVDFARPIRKGIRWTSFLMLKTPVSFMGVRGIRRLARALTEWPRTMHERAVRLNVGQVVMIQEQIGTGGAGFRFMYAAFLQEAAAVLSEPRLAEASRAMTAAGDRWRDFALVASRFCQGRPGPDDTLDRMAEIVRDCADREESIYRAIRRVAS